MTLFLCYVILPHLKWRLASVTLMGDNKRFWFRRFYFFFNILHYLYCLIVLIIQNVRWFKMSVLKICAHFRQLPRSSRKVPSSQAQLYISYLNFIFCSIKFAGLISEYFTCFSEFIFVYLYIYYHFTMNMFLTLCIHNFMNAIALRSRLWTLNTEHWVVLQDTTKYRVKPLCR
jgi:hypothetical protein